MLDFIFKKLKWCAQLQMGPYMYAKFQLSTLSRFGDIESTISAEKKNNT